jgi:nicotinamidase-related amidase
MKSFPTTAATGAVLLAAIATPAIADIISDWTTAVTPRAPEIKEVTVDPSTTALLLLGLMKTNCGVQPRCVAVVPNIKRVHDVARARNMVVWYALVAENGGKGTPDEVIDPAIRPRPGEWYRLGGPEKFAGSTLQPILRQAGVKTVIICGYSFEGPILGTAIEATQRGYKVTLPVDCSAGRSEYREQYVTYELSAGGPDAVTGNVTLTRTTMLKFSSSVLHRAN